MVKMKHYEGVLGNFDYDAAQFKVTREPRSNSEYLKYIGKENDGSRIVIPNGVVDAYRMFDGSRINSMPEIPASVKYGAKMFRKCTNLNKVDTFPENIVNWKDMFEGCKRSVKLSAQELFEQSGRGSDTIMYNQRQGENEVFSL